ncbi:23858_t:CDS:2, partial [Racocetra persica]
MFNENFTSLQDAAPTYDAVPTCNILFSLDDSSNKHSSKSKTGISTIKRHFENNHNSKYQKCLQSSDLQVVKYYGVQDINK